MFDDDSDAASTLSGMGALAEAEEAREAERRRQQQQSSRGRAVGRVDDERPVKKAPPRVAVPRPAAAAEPFPIKPWNAPTAASRSAGPARGRRRRGLDRAARVDRIEAPQFPTQQPPRSTRGARRRRTGSASCR